MPAGVLAFICAMPLEAFAVAHRLDVRRTRIAGRPGYRGEHRGRPVVVIITGIGTQRARAATHGLLDEVDVGRVVVVGVTGAVDDATPIGRLVVPELVVDAATGTEHRPAPIGSLAQAGTMWTTNEILVDPTVLADLRTRGVVSLDMETAAIGDVCETRGVPWSVIRAVSDRATDGSVDDAILGLSRPDGRADPRAVARYLARQPTRLPGLIRLAQGARIASETAAFAAVDATAAS